MASFVRLQTELWQLLGAAQLSGNVIATWCPKTEFETRQVQKETGLVMGNPAGSCIYLAVIISYLSSSMCSSFQFVSLSYSIMAYLVLVYGSFVAMLSCVLYLVLTGYMYCCCIIRISVMSCVAASHCYTDCIDCCGACGLSACIIVNYYYYHYYWNKSSTSIVTNKITHQRHWQKQGMYFNKQITTDKPQLQILPVLYSAV